MLWVLLPATTGNWQSHSLGTRQPDHRSQTTRSTAVRPSHTDHKSAYRKMCAVTERHQPNIVYLVFTDVGHVQSSAPNNLQRETSPDMGYASSFPSRLHKSQHSQQLPSPIVASATTLTRRHLHHSLTSSLLSCFCILPEASPPSPVPRQPPTALKILIPSLKGLRLALLPFPVHSG